MAHIYVRSGAGGGATGADWANAFLTLAAGLAAAAAGDNIWVAEDHAESAAAAATLTSPGTAAAPCKIICVDKAGTVPPVSADIRATATVTTTGTAAIAFTGYAYYEGIAFSAGTGAGNSSISMAPAANFRSKFKNCKFILAGTHSAANIAIATTGAFHFDIEWINCTVKFAALTQIIFLTDHGRFTWRDTASAIAVAGTIPTNLMSSTRHCVVELRGLDLSAAGSGKTIISTMTACVSHFYLDGCTLDPAVTITATPTTPGPRTVVTRCSDTAGNNVERMIVYEGTQIEDLAVVRTGGQSDGATGKSAKITPTANVSVAFPFASLPLGIFNAVTGANVVITLEGIANPQTFSALPKDIEISMIAEYMGAAGNPKLSEKSNLADVLATGTALTASTQAWDGQATARQNSHAYSLGDIFKVASNPGRLFICTSAGTSDGTEPAGFASAVDGGSVTDNGATFKAMWRFKMSVTLTSPQPAQVGAVFIRPQFSKAPTAGPLCWLDEMPAVA